MQTITLLVDSEYQGRGVVIHLHVFTTLPAGVTVRPYAIRVLLSEILIGACLSHKTCSMARSLDPRRILILLLRSQRRDQVAVRVVTPHPNIEFVIHVRTALRTLFQSYLFMVTSPRVRRYVRE